MINPGYLVFIQFSFYKRIPILNKLPTHKSPLRILICVYRRVKFHTFIAFSKEKYATFLNGRICDSDLPEIIASDL